MIEIELQTKEYTAWDLAGDWWWVNDYDACTLRGVYTLVWASRSQQSCGLARVDQAVEGWRTIVRYVTPDTKMTLRAKRQDDHMAEKQKWNIETQIGGEWQHIALSHLAPDEFYDADLVVEEAQRLADQYGIPHRVSNDWTSKIFYPTKE